MFFVKHVGQSNHPVIQPLVLARFLCKSMMMDLVILKTIKEVIIFQKSIVSPLSWPTHVAALVDICRITSRTPLFVFAEDIRADGRGLGLSGLDQFLKFRF